MDDNDFTPIDPDSRNAVARRIVEVTESWADFSGMGLPKLKTLGKGELSDDEVTVSEYAGAGLCRRK